MVPTLSKQGPNPVVPTLPVVEVNVPLLEVAATYAYVRLGAEFGSWPNEEAKKSMEVFVRRVNHAASPSCMVSRV